MKYKNITDIFFDLDHTIYDFDKNSELTFFQIFKELKLEGMDDFMIYFKPINDYYWSLLSRNEITHDELRIARLKDTFEKIGVTVTNDQINFIADQFIANLTNFNHVFDGAYETLDYLKNKYRLHIITNGPDHVQVKKLKNTNLDTYFLTVTNSELAGVKKPNKAIFDFGLNLANVQPNKALMIGDNLEADILGAINAGIDVIWFNQYQEENLNKVTEITELKQLINIL